MTQLTPTRIEIERRSRIRLAVAAYAYEIKNDNIMSDHDFDELSKCIDLSVSTGEDKLDAFFRRYFEPATGMWVRKHPNKTGLERIYRMLKQQRP